MWGNTWGGLLLRTGGVNEVENCDPSIADPTNFVNNLSTGDWEYQLTHEQIVRMFKRLFNVTLPGPPARNGNGKAQNPTNTKPINTKPTNTKPINTKPTSTTTTELAENFVRERTSEPFILQI